MHLLPNYYQSRKQRIRSLDIIFAISLLVFILIGIIVYKTMAGNIEYSTKTNLQKDAQIAASEIDAYFVKYGVLTQQMLTNETLTTYIKEVKSKDQKQQHPNFPMVVETLNQIKATDKNVSEAWIAVTAMNDLVTTDSNWSTKIGYNMRERPWFQKMVNSHQIPTYTDPYIDNITGGLVISIVAPVYADNQVVGNVGIDLYFDTIKEFMKTYTIGETGYPILVSDTGTILYHPNSKFMFTTRLSQLSIQFNQLEKMMRAGQSGINEIPYENVAKYFAYAPVKAPGFSVATVIEKSETQASIKALNTLSTMILTAIITIILVLRALIRLVTNYSELSELYEELSAVEEELQAQYQQIQNSKELLEESEALYRILVENSQDMIYTLDPGGKLKSVNTAFENFTGIDRYALIGQEYKTILSTQGDIQRWERLLQSVINTGQAKQMTDEYCNDQGIKISYDITLIPNLNPSGKVVSITGTNHDISDVLSQEERIQHLAYYDQLTGLPNRVLFEERVKELINLKCERRFAVLYFDLDDFKKVNDSIGHMAGDILLKDIANLLRAMQKEINFAARMSGDEFAMIIHDCNDESCIAGIIEHIKSAFHEPWCIQNTLHYLSCSMGVAIFPEDGQTYEELLKNADTAMYAVKKSGKNSWRKFDIQMQTELNSRLEMERHLRSALDKGEILIHYQPLITTATNQIRGFEALMRWKSEIYGWVSPTKFIPILEDTALIVAYGEWMMLNACKQNYQWQQKHRRQTVVSVNVSALEFKRKNFVQQVVRILEASQLEPEYLEIEITESILIDDLFSVMDVLKELRQIGVKISLDDFGTGFSSLNYLRQLPINTLKVDRTFISDINLNKERTAILRSIINLAHDLQLEMVAEGVETREQLEFLQHKNCDLLQGYYLYRPLPAEQIDIILSPER